MLALSATMQQLTCSFKGCTNTSAQKKVTFFGFPCRKDDICKKWIKNSGNEVLVNLSKEDLVKHHLCECHFKKSEIKTVNNKKCLWRDAIPIEYTSPERENNSYEEKKTRLESISSALSRQTSPSLTNEVLPYKITMASEQDIEVDPELFSLCRLCIDTKGRFLVGPYIEQIEYCYGFKININDGLPQIICEACMVKVKSFYFDKKMYSEKQKSLGSRKSNPGQRQVETVSSSQQDVGNVPNVEEAKPDSCQISYSIPPQTIIAARNLIETSSNSAESQEELHPASSAEVKDPLIDRNVGILKLKINSSQSKPSAQVSNDMIANKKHKSTHKPRDGEVDKLIREALELRGYKPAYFCKMCKTKATHKGIKRHVKENHHGLKTMIQELVPKECSIRLQRVDEKHNIAGTLNYVVISPKKIINNKRYNNYFQRYEMSDDSESEEDMPGYQSDSSIKTIPAETAIDDITVDDKSSLKRILNVEEEEPVRPKKRKRLRISSDSDTSSGASVLKEPPLSTLSEAETDIESHRLRVKKVVQSTLGAHENLKNEESVLKAHELLNKKILNVGVKTMGKKGFSSIGILKYLEKKHLEVNWIDSSRIPDAQSGTWQARIYPELIKSDDVSKSFASFKVLKQRKKDYSKTTNEPPRKDNKVGNMVSAPMSNLLNESLLPYPGLSSDDNDLLLIEDVIPTITIDTIDLDSDDENAVGETVEINNDTQDKASVGNENNMNKENVTGEEGIGSNDEIVSSSMPIITSTTSLAEQRPILLKCKPVSELMASGTKKPVSTENANLLINPINATVVGPPLADPNVVTATSLNMHDYSLPLSQENLPSVSADESSGGQFSSIILNSPSLPNVLTCTPFKYIEKLLALNKIKFLISTTALPAFYESVAKYSVSIFQKPVTVALHVHCLIAANCVCLKIRYEDKTHVKVESLDARWQWQIIKSIISTDVKPKIISSSRVLGNDFFTTAKNFVALLSTIQSDADDSVGIKSLS